MKKVLLCTNSYKHLTNGPARFANLFYKSFDNQSQFIPFILTEDVIFNDQKRVFKLKISDFAKKNIFSQLFRNYYYFKQIKKLNEHFKFDVILFNNSSTGILSSLFYHDKSLGFINDNENICLKFFPVKFKRSYFRRVYLKFLENISTKTFKTIVTNSNFLTELIIKKYNLNSNKVKRLYKAVDLESFGSLKWHNYYKGEGLITITFMKNDFVRGGLWDLAESLKLLEKYNFKLNIIGPNPNFKQLIENNCRASNVQINFIGPTKQENINKILLKSHLFCTPSREEALGVSNLEALAMGIPVVSTNVGGIPEIMNNGENGYLAEASNSKSLMLQIEKCLISTAKTKVKVKNGRKFVNKFSKEILYKNIYEIIKDT